MKIQAITAKPLVPYGRASSIKKQKFELRAQPALVENFNADGIRPDMSQCESVPAGQGRLFAASHAPDTSAMAALRQQGQSQYPNGQEGKGNFLRGADGG
jgi:hypothetical protein